MRSVFSLTLPLLAVLATTPSAYAIHGYHSDWCHVADGAASRLPFSFRSNRDWAEAGSKSDLNQNTITGTIVDSAKPMDQGDEFQALKTKVTNVKNKDYDDGCWTGTQGTYDAVIVILKASKKAIALGMKPGMEISVHCEPEDIDPDGPSC
ncbi:MAG: hypothetical protein ACXVCS_09315 [Bdellovibrionota bacterium]